MIHGRFTSRHQPTAFERPRGARGIIPLIMGAMAVGKGIVSAVQANQRKKKNEGFIDANYQLAKKKLTRRQGDVRQGTSESLNARGLAQGGLSAIHAAMAPPASLPRNTTGITGGVAQRPVPARPHTLGEQVQSDNETEFGLENQDLDNQKKQADSANVDARTNAYISAGVGAAQGIMGAMSAGQDLSAAANVGNGSIADASAPGSFGSSAIRSSMTGIDDPANTFGGIPLIDPHNAPGSPWNLRTRIAAPGETAATFNVG